MRRNVMLSIASLLLILLFSIHMSDDFDMALKRARALVVRLEQEQHANPNTLTKEFSIRDPDGYYVTISALSSPDRTNHQAPEA